MHGFCLNSMPQLTGPAAHTAPRRERRSAAAIVPGGLRGAWVRRGLGYAPAAPDVRELLEARELGEAAVAAALPARLHLMLRAGRQEDGGAQATHLDHLAGGPQRAARLHLDAREVVQVVDTRLCTLRVSEDNRLRTAVVGPDVVGALSGERGARLHLEARATAH
eukprot:CAMPEP_0179910736 /NCGR_PEP_ID=MMETSP0982-20121206/45935_1 /TAXON_ID=483367 /ORGANISM="non described non described, Strain CCMP 2436" /LENGTH=164 /DNA_ID=CAMNT_0021812327 /DNA_START=1554 /DNA_END=2048 /DNA_ORIENTATION=+